jgi:hypothetical protein
VHDGLAAWALAEHLLRPRVSADDVQANGNIPPGGQIQAAAKKRFLDRQRRGGLARVQPHLAYGHDAWLFQQLAKAIESAVQVLARGSGWMHADRGQQIIPLASKLGRSGRARQIDPNIEYTRNASRSRPTQHCVDLVWRVAIEMNVAIDQHNVPICQTGHPPGVPAHHHRARASAEAPPGRQGGFRPGSRPPAGELPR